MANLYRNRRIRAHGPGGVGLSHSDQQLNLALPVAVWAAFLAAQTWLMLPVEERQRLWKKGADAIGKAIRQMKALGGPTRRSSVEASGGPDV